MSYSLGLSLLTNFEKMSKKHSSSEAIRILSILDNRKINMDDISKEAGGRPFFHDKDTDFNISHSGNMVIVSHVTKNGYRVGCDIEKIKPRKNIAKIAADKFSVSENKYLYTDGIFNNINFFKIWTLKESYIKLQGLSVFDMSKVPSFIKENDQTNSLDFSFCADTNKPLTFRLYELSNINPDTKTENTEYILAEAFKGDYLQPELIWLSPSSLTLDCKMIAEIKAAVSPAHTVSPNR